MKTKLEWKMPMYGFHIWNLFQFELAEINVSQHYGKFYSDWQRDLAGRIVSNELSKDLSSSDIFTNAVC